MNVARSKFVFAVLFGAAVLTPHFVITTYEPDLERAERDLSLLSEAVLRYQAVNGQYPSNLPEALADEPLPVDRFSTDSATGSYGYLRISDKMGEMAVIYTHGPHRDLCFDATRLSVHQRDATHYSGRMRVEGSFAAWKQPLLPWSAGRFPIPSCSHNQGVKQ